MYVYLLRGRFTRHSGEKSAELQKWEEARKVTRESERCVSGWRAVARYTHTFSRDLDGTEVGVFRRSEIVCVCTLRIEVIIWKLYRETRLLLLERMMYEKLAIEFPYARIKAPAEKEIGKYRRETLEASLIAFSMGRESIHGNQRQYTTFVFWKAGRPGDPSFDGLAKGKRRDSQSQLTVTNSWVLDHNSPTNVEHETETSNKEKKEEQNTREIATKRVAIND